MINDILIISSDQVKEIEWTGDSKTYDQSLYQLGPNDQPFIILNPWASDTKPFYFVRNIKKTVKCTVLKWKGEWIAKHFPSGWNPKKGYVSVEIELPKLKWVINPSLGRHTNFDQTEYKNYFPDPWESKHELVWYLDPKTHFLKDKVWAFKCLPVNADPIEIIDMGLVKPNLPSRLDVVFLSYDEPIAEKNWCRVLEKAPWAKRIHGVKGIFEAHQKAAEISTTEMFFVVDADAWLVDSWKFQFDPSIFDRDCTYIWLSKNPYNDLIYGYGGVKLFSKYNLLKAKKWPTLDLTTTLTPNIKVMNKISVITEFNQDEFSTWRSAFRESVKLCAQGQTTILNNWVTKKEVQHSEFALRGLEDGKNFYLKNKNNKSQLLKINNIEWLKNQFKNVNF